MAFQADYFERVYAGVLGKLIVVYLGRPIEGWTHERIEETVGEVDHYIHDIPGLRRPNPLVVTDDDVTGTFTFLRALEDEGYSRDLTPEQIGNNWLNYTIERRSIFWWGGVGNSTEHTAYARLKAGIKAPESGSAALNGRVISEQIGSQIFIDGWGMVAPGDPEFAVDLARRAASVSHDGEAIYGAQMVAAMVSQAFIESDIDTLIDTGLGLIPADSIIARLIHDVRAWHAAEPDWRKTRARIAANYGYDKYGGACHMVPNHGLIIHALLHGNGDFTRSQMIVNTSGWDTDCNAANVGCILGVRGGLAALEQDYDWRGPVADRMYLSTADGGRGITDALTESVRVVNAARALAGEAPITPKDGAKFHFSLPGSVQGFQPDPAAPVVIANEAGGESRRLVLRTEGAPGGAFTPTFIPEEAIRMDGYELYASPTLSSGQTVTAVLAAPADHPGPVKARLALRHYTGADTLQTLAGPDLTIAPGETATITWTIPDLDGCPVEAIGVQLDANSTVALDRLDWSGAPTFSYHRPADAAPVLSGVPGAQPAGLWRRAWVAGVDHYGSWWPEAIRISQDTGRGILSQGTRDWVDYQVQSTITPYLAGKFGIAARVQGLRRYYALLLGVDGVARLVKMDDTETVLAEAPHTFTVFEPSALTITVEGDRITGSIAGGPTLTAVDSGSRLSAGGIGLVIEEGTIGADEVRVTA
ncbi:MAG: ADP-ribosylglycohydrolase family protein [Thermomicrobiales bacterium]|nr:ADP-ribosylglycohydrolase family protein [Thermomicrobiales bacterium]